MVIEEMEDDNANFLFGNGLMDEALMIDGTSMDENYGLKNKKKALSGRYDDSQEFMPILSYDGEDDRLMNVLDQAALDHVLFNVNEQKCNEIINTLKNEECKFMSEVKGGSRGTDARLERDSVSEVSDFFAMASGNDLLEILGVADSSTMLDDHHADADDGMELFGHPKLDRKRTLSDRSRHNSSSYVSTESLLFKGTKIKIEPIDKENAMPTGLKCPLKNDDVCMVNYFLGQANSPVVKEENTDVADEMFLARMGLTSYLDPLPNSTIVDNGDMLDIYNSYDEEISGMIMSLPEEYEDEMSEPVVKKEKRKPGRPRKKTAANKIASRDNFSRRKGSVSSIGSSSTFTSDTFTGDDSDYGSSAEWIAKRRLSARPVDSTLRRPIIVKSAGQYERKSQRGGGVAAGIRRGGRGGRKSDAGRQLSLDNSSEFEYHSLTTISRDSDDDSIVDVVTVPTLEEPTTVELDEVEDTRIFLPLIRFFHNYGATPSSSSASAAIQQQLRMQAIRDRLHRKRTSPKFTLSESIDDEAAKLSSELPAPFSPSSSPPPQPPVQFRPIPVFRQAPPTPTVRQTVRTVRSVTRPVRGRGGGVAQSRRGAKSRRGGGVNLTRLSDEQRSKREALNDLERRRRREMTSELTALRVVVPAVQNNPRAAKVNILNSAAAHILMLQRAHQRYQEIYERECQTAMQLQERLRQLRS